LFIRAAAEDWLLYGKGFSMRRGAAMMTRILRVGYRAMQEAFTIKLAPPITDVNDMMMARDTMRLFGAICWLHCAAPTGDFAPSPFRQLIAALLFEMNARRGWRGMALRGGLARLTQPAPRRLNILRHLVLPPPFLLGCRRHHGIFL